MRILDEKYEKIIQSLDYILKMCGLKSGFINEKLDNGELLQSELDSALMELIDTILIDDKELLYNLEYKVAELRKTSLGYVEDEENLTLKKVLDLGFNNVHININGNNENVGIYKDNENEYVANGYFITKNDELLNAKVKYVGNNTYTDYYGDYLEIEVSFIDEKYNKILENELGE